MKFDQDLFRDLLIEVECLPSTGEPTQGQLFFKSFNERHDYKTQPDITEHLRLALEAGYIKASCYDRYDSRGVHFHTITRLTYSGHQFLALIRDDTTWKKITNWSKKIGTQGSISTVTTLAEKAIAEALDKL